MKVIVILDNRQDTEYWSTACPHFLGGEGGGVGGEEGEWEGGVSNQIDSYVIHSSKKWVSKWIQ